MQERNITAGTAQDKCEVILQWIQAAVVNHIAPQLAYQLKPGLLGPWPHLQPSEDSHVLDVPPPIITRVFQELSRGRVSLEQVQTIIDAAPKQGWDEINACDNRPRSRLKKSCLHNAEKIRRTFRERNRIGSDLRCPSLSHMRR